MIRGEETQILGVLDQLGAGRHTICLPGTHSKWVEVENGKIVHLLCTPQLADVYRQALDVLGLESSTLDPNAVTRGLFRLASKLDKR